MLTPDSTSPSDTQPQPSIASATVVSSPALTSSQSQSHTTTPPTTSPDPNLLSPPEVHRVQFSPAVNAPHASAGDDGRFDEPEPGMLRRRLTRAVTFRSVEQYGEHEGQINWEPGSEPGIDRLRHDGPPVWCRIVVIEWSVDRVRKRFFDNHSFIDFLKKPQEAWVRCRWISINGINTDVVLAVAAHKRLHKLAVDDLVEPNSRPKADWYADHVFIVLSMQRAIEINPEEDPGSSSSPDSSDAASATTAISTRNVFRRLRRWYRGIAPTTLDNEMGVVPEVPVAGACPPGFRPPGPYKTLQRYHASPNQERTKFMERNSTLLDADKGLLVIAEQVSVFLTSDNTVVSFFEASASCVEDPLLKRLNTPGTVLRESCDASMLTQAIIDTIVDLAMPVVEKYAAAVDNIELEVLLKPDIEQSRRLYVVISEVNKMLTFLNPIDNVVNVLRDHRTDLSPGEAATGVIITPMTHTYLGDVLDHCVMITENMVQIKQSSQNLIDLIFNTISANQNDFMRLLTTVTIIFLPMTFITGFFGQNFEDFPQTKLGIGYFWQVTIPTLVLTILLVSWNPVSTSIRAYWKKRHIRQMRKERLAQNSKRIRQATLNMSR